MTRPVRAFVRRHVPAPLRRVARWALTRRTHDAAYEERIAQETSAYADCVEVHDLPPICHYWSNRYLRPKLVAFGFGHPDEFFASHVAASYHAAGEGPRRFLSIGAGNCDTEVRLAAALAAAGCNDFVIECMDLNDDMLRRGCDEARAAGLDRHVVPLHADFNRWRPAAVYDAIVANQSLHHVLELESLFDSVYGSLAPHGRFIVSDMIGRNGHLRWPEARSVVDEFWSELPMAYRFNRQLSRQEEAFADWDCSIAGFEGIRAQDILPLLVERFGFDLFIGFANVVDPFIGRSFGGNFDAAGAWDQAFVDRVHARDEAELAAGRVKPTHMFAVMGRSAGSNRHLPGLSPRESIRWPDGKR